MAAAGLRTETVSGIAYGAGQLGSRKRATVLFPPVHPRRLYGFLFQAFAFLFWSDMLPAEETATGTELAASRESTGDIRAQRPSEEADHEDVANDALNGRAILSPGLPDSNGAYAQSGHAGSNPQDEDRFEVFRVAVEMWRAIHVQGSNTGDPEKDQSDQERYEPDDGYQ